MNIRRSLRRLTTSGLFVLLIILFTIAILWRHIVITVPAGHAGLMWWRFLGGTDLTSPPRGEGIQLIFPWDHLIIYDTRLQELSETFNIVANNGLNLKVTASVRWKLRADRLGELHQKVGPDYVKRLLMPEVASVLRETITRYSAEDLYAKDRLTIQQAIYRSLVEAKGNEIGGHSLEEDPAAVISLTDVLIAEIELPVTLRAAIERKFEQAELVEEYRFRVKREQLESDRKAIEADGIRRFQETVTPAISDEFLRWSGIDATLKLAQSPNSKIVIMGNGPGGLPVILNGFEGDKALTIAPAGEIVPQPPLIQTPLPPAP
jgi:regulator of protease activity HflC (stomatin/prohibitin superfamily)